MVVELFTAQGCSSCAEASDHARPSSPSDKGVLALTFAVDYWDYLGWKDTFAKPEFAERQRAYAGRPRLAEVYTPQVVVDGTTQTPAPSPTRSQAGARGAPARPARSAARCAARGGRLPSARATRPRGGAEVWLVRYDPREQEVEVKDGDNRGHTVRRAQRGAQLVQLGAWRGAPKLLRLPEPAEPGLDDVVLVQAMHGGRILAARKLPAEPRP